MEEVESFKYLGVWFDQRMKGNVQLEKMVEQAEEWAGKFEWVKGYEQFFISVVISLHQQLHRTEATFSALQEKYHNVHHRGTAIKNILATTYYTLL